MLDRSQIIIKYTRRHKFTQSDVPVINKHINIRRNLGDQCSASRLPFGPILKREIENRELDITVTCQRIPQLALFIML